jgi:hypothetical protein
VGKIITPIATREAKVISHWITFSIGSLFFDIKKKV